MLSSIICWIGILLQALILARGCQSKLLAKYPFFYAYGACVLILTVPAYFVYAANSNTYGFWYWGEQLVSLIAGYGILLEIFKHVLSPYPGAEKFARITGIMVFGAILCFALVFPLVRSHSSASVTMVEFERDLRTVQAIFVSGLLVVITYYGIEIGKNMKGMIFGYGLYIVTSLVSLAVRAYAGPSFTEVWRIIQPLSYDVSLMIWMMALWSYHPTPIPESRVRLEAEYEALAARTRGAMGGMRAELGRVARP